MDDYEFISLVMTTALYQGPSCPLLRKQNKLLNHYFAQKIDTVLLHNQEEYHNSLILQALELTPLAIRARRLGQLVYIVVGPETRSDILYLQMH